MAEDTQPTHTFVAFENSAIEQSIAARFEQQVAHYADRLAVVTPELQFTYVELNRSANRIARAVLTHL
jgi:non-ribosomal peptide synthetase component F